MEDRKQALLNAVKTAVSLYGVNGASTRKIAETAGVDDTYVYLLFKEKNLLLYQAYEMEITPIIDETVSLIRQLTGNKLGLHLRDSAGIIFKKIWERLVSDAELCAFLNYYYHSQLFQKYAWELHRQQTEELVDALNWLFWNEREAKSCIYGLFTVVFDNSLNVATGRIPNTPETEQLVFDLLFNMLYNQSKRAKESPILYQQGGKK